MKLRGCSVPAGLRTCLKGALQGGYCREARGAQAAAAERQPRPRDGHVPQRRQQRHDRFRGGAGGEAPRTIVHRSSLRRPFTVPADRPGVAITSDATAVLVHNVMHTLFVLDGGA